MKYKFTGLLGTLALVAAVSGCASAIPGTSIDTEKAEIEIAKAIEEQTGTAVTLTCPDEAELKPGEEMSCSVTDSTGSKRTVRVSLKDADGNLIWILDEDATPAKTG